MQRRKFIAGVGSLAAAGAAGIGTGAFTSINAERSVTVSTESDADGANLGLEPNDDYDGNVNEFAQVTDGTLELTLEDNNKNAVTMYKDLITVTNNGNQDCEVYVNNGFGDWDTNPTKGNGYGSSGPVEILNGHDYNSDNKKGDSIVGGNTMQTPGDNPVLGPGESVTLTVVVDTRGHGDVDIDGEILIKAV